MRTRRKAFTLIELLVVISIISLLISILLPSLRKARLASQKTVAASNLRSVGQAHFLYASDNHQWLPPISATGEHVNRYKAWNKLVKYKYASYKSFSSPLVEQMSTSFSIRKDGYNNWSYLAEDGMLVVAYASWKHGGWGVREANHKLGQTATLTDSHLKMAWNYQYDIPQRLGFAHIVYMDGHVIQSPTNSYTDWASFMYLCQ
ncbi:MAG: hypothetical protein CMJ19_21445 [Phycisphaeraceae bacterium]|nr:hypothetical protein [Phycisphaeraceae bacterium]